MSDLTIKEKILKTLLESSKTTGKIAIELGYIDKKGHGRYNIIKPDLNTLEQYGCIHRIESNVKTLGAPPTTYDIVYEISILRKILEKYPSLVLDLQKNERIISMVADKQNLFVKHPPDSLELKTAKIMLSLSWSFFHNYVINASFLDTFCELWWETYHEDMDEDNLTLDYKGGTEYERTMSDGAKWIFSRHNSPLSEILIDAFEHSIITDRIKGVYNPESFDYLRTTPAHGIVSSYPEKPIYVSRAKFLKEFRKGSFKYLIYPVI